MNNRIMMVVMTGALMTLATGCSPCRDFFFGRGARCGLCNRNSAPPMRTAPPPSCGTPRCGTPQCNSGGYVPSSAAPGNCGCGNPVAPMQSSCGSCGNSPVVSGYAPDPYSSTVIGNGIVEGTVMEGQTVYGDSFVPAPTTSQGVRANYQGYGSGSYKVDRDGNRIVYEEPLPAGAISPN